MDNEVYERIHLILAALLHDIGKFWQRAQEEPWRPAPGYEVTEKHHSGWVHATWSAAFVERCVPRQWCAPADVLYHHQPPDRRSKLVALADRLASGEREEEEGEEVKPLLSIFSRLMISKDRGEPPPKYLPLKALALREDVLFPNIGVAESQVREGYADLWGAFVAEAEGLKEEGEAISYADSLYYLLQKYTWCVPSAYWRSVPDVPLFDHARVTAALAVCLDEEALSEVQLDEMLKSLRDWYAARQGSREAEAPPVLKEPHLLLVCGDISGVQDFIYTLTSKGVAKGLRGRSFYLQLLTEATARFVLRHLKLPLVNLIYIGGGRFYLLAPLSARGGLEKARQEVSQALLRAHGGDLYLALGWTELAAAHFRLGVFSEKWRETNRATNEAKRRRFSELPADEQAVIFAPQGHGGNEDEECEVCHYEGKDVKKRGREDEPKENWVRKCALCASLEDLGRDLRDAAYLILAEVEPQEIKARGDWRTALRGLGLEVRLADEKGKRLGDGGPAPERATVLAMQDIEDEKGALERIKRGLGCPLSTGARYTVNITPWVSPEDVAWFKERYPKSNEVPEANTVKEFGLLQKQSQGIERLGVLRMDVDDLGDLFAYGFRREGEKVDLSTISRVANLSFQLGLFFEGWVGVLCQAYNRGGDRAGEKGTDRVYSIYSGGDDLFIVGSWDVLPDLAHDIHQDLGRFAADNPDVHLSAGLSLHGAKFPLYQAAEEAHGTLEEAKGLMRPGSNGQVRGKDAFHFLGQTIGWERYKDVKDLMTELKKLVTEEGVSRALLNTLMRLSSQYTGGKRKNKLGREQFYWGPWHWQRAYFLTRLAERYGRDEALRKRIEKIRDDLGSESFRHIEIAGLAARWAELLTRQEK